MPLHAQIACIGGNAFFALLFLIAAQMGFAAGEFGMTVFMFALAAAAAYTCWVLVKFRRYLSAETAMERELRIEQMREEIDRLRANNAPEA
jgi:membrane protein implicated in regulation of membrane protease activity